MRVRNRLETESLIHVDFRGHTLSLKGRAKEDANAISTELLVWDENGKDVTRRLAGRRGTVEDYIPNPTSEDIYAVMKAIARKRPLKKVV
jgi:hypothetical protein